MNTLTGTGGLARLILRRDRVLMPLWVVLLGLIPLSYVASINELFPTAAGRHQYFAASAHNAAFVALYGRLFGDDLGQLVAWRAGFLPIVVGLFAILTVVRHTRTEEESGRRELLASTVAGRHAGLAAALLTTLVASLVMGLLLAVGMLGQDMPASGSWAFGMQLTLAGWVFAAVGGVAAQLTSGAGSARGTAIIVLGVAYVLRVVGDMSGIGDGTLSWVAWLSPFGWAEHMRPYGDEQWWSVLPAVAFTGLLAAAAVALSARRDVGAGLLPPRLGPASAAPGLASPLALSWRLHRGLLAGWAAGFAVLGVVLGYLAGSIGDLVRDNAQMSEIFANLGGASGLIDSYLAAMTQLFGLVGAGYAIQATLRARAEESAGRAEPVLGTAVGRIRWLGGHLVFSLLGPAVLLAVAGLAVGLTHGLNTGAVGHEVPRALAGTLVQLPAVWILAAITVLLFGLLPRFSAASWAGLAICLLVGLVGTALGVDDRVLDISPFTHLPKLPGDDFTPAPLLWLTAMAILLTTAGLTAFRRRDVPVG
ncbi:exporter of polyketide antibiotics [Sphaerisporangium siamense]|uniref:ABC-2 type transport system permease protein n=1 Tax=Sphaerisporangium siamense TaxID=795645 RepID=A0A7W7D7A6_9ACTN|nr:ABC transporter permease [Sphaerisporangium siamense]MBB4700188.1 ABC-2 type transport system permease protein [Sphaerisporangium siamense]GII84499.1 exporter of polyketide antibiotics [Sphaerisporangium siamense]